MAKDIKKQNETLRTRDPVTGRYIRSANADINELKSKKQNVITKFVDSGFIGKVIHFKYDPKYKDRLSIYDYAPLVIFLNTRHNGFEGINLHFAPSTEAALFILEEASKNLNNTEMDITTRMLVTYDLLRTAKSFGMVQECYRRYLFSHLRSGVIIIQPEQWQESVVRIAPNFKEGLKK